MNVSTTKMWQHWERECTMYICTGQRVEKRRTQIKTTKIEQTRETTIFLMNPSVICMAQVFFMFISLWANMCSFHFISRSRTHTHTLTRSLSLFHLKTHSNCHLDNASSIFPFQLWSELCVKCKEKRHHKFTINWTRYLRYSFHFNSFSILFYLILFYFVLCVRFESIFCVVKLQTYRQACILLMQITDQLTMTPGNKSVFMAILKTDSVHKSAWFWHSLFIYSIKIYLCFTYHLHSSLFPPLFAKSSCNRYVYSISIDRSSRQRWMTKTKIRFVALIPLLCWSIHWIWLIFRSLSLFLSLFIALMH